MKKSFNLMITLGLVLLTWSAQAQYDDVYYGSTSNRTRTRAVSNSDYSNRSQSYQDDRNYEDRNSTESDNPDYDDQSYNYLDDYDYTYTHAIRRFQRPLVGRGFYDSYYLDPWNYDPFYYSSGFGMITPSLGLGFYSFYDYNRWNRWYHFNQFRYWDPWTYSYWSYDPFSCNRFSNYYWASNSWCPTSWYSNNLYYGSSFWGNAYNGAYQPKYYTSSNVHFGPRAYGATTTGDHGPSRTSSRILSDPHGYGNPGLNRVSPREAGTTVVRERDIPVNRDRSLSNPDATSERLSPRQMDSRNTIRERTTSAPSERTFRDFNNNTDPNQSSRLSSPRDYSPRQESPRFESPRQESPRFESPRQEAPRFESPRNNTASPRSNNYDQSSSYSPRSNRYSGSDQTVRSFTPRHESSSGRSFSNAPSYSSPRSSGGYSSGGSGGSSHSYSGGGGRSSSPRH